jgi:hypothetical protein
MAMLNRSAVVVRPKQPYIDWSKQVFPESDLAFDPSKPDALPVFLLPDVAYSDDVTTLVEKNFRYFFEHWLGAWCTDESRWPKRRTRKMFKEWFDFSIHTWVDDVVDFPYERLE